jgi:hypothetical protein
MQVWKHSSRQRNYNWFTRFFRIKPASEVIVINISKARARREVVKILREWKQYGMERVHFDKRNNIVYGRVGPANSRLQLPFVSSTKIPLTILTVLRLRPIEFSGEFHTVLEHGRHANFSLIRFKQERGAASPFHKVVDTIRVVLRHRGLLVEDSLWAKKVTKLPIVSV